MIKFFAALVAASTLLVAAESRACNPVQAITSYQSAALVAPVVAPVTYQPMVTQQSVQQVVAQPVYAQAVLAQPVVQQVVVKQRVKGCRQFRTPVRSLLFR